MSNEKHVLKVGGMTCTGCANTIKTALEKEGATNVFVDFSMGEAVFQKPEQLPIEKFIRAIEKSGYIVKDEEEQNIHQHHKKSTIYFIISVVLTIPLLLSMFLPFEILQKVEVQFLLATPVIILGMLKFGKSAIQSILHKSPNMDVLILSGSLAAYIYSITGWLLHNSHHYLFFETAAAIICFVMLGNIIEEYSIAKTTEEIKKLQKSNEIKTATKKIDRNGKVDYTSVSIDEIMIGDVLLIKEGEQVPLDGKILSGEVEVNESIITGESIPVYKKTNDEVIAGTTIIKGNIEMYVTRRKSETILAQIVDAVKRAQRDKTEIQKLGDKISAIFVPAVILIALLTGMINYLIFHQVSESVLRAIAVLVISCPCAMGLAAPTAVAVSLGIAARHRVLFKSSAAFELIHKSKVFVFDKTGTLTTGQFAIEKFEIFSNKYSSDKILSLVYSAESRSLHPIAKSIAEYARQNNAKGSLLIDFVEEKGKGIAFKEYNDVEKITYRIGSYRILKDVSEDISRSYDVFVTANDELIAAFKLKDELRPETKNVMSYLRQHSKEVYILSGDKKEKCLQIANELGIPESNVLYEQLPDEKLQQIERLKSKGLVCMIGDGINDAPAMAKADVSVSFNHSSSIAIDSAQIIISHQNVFEQLLFTLELSRITIQKIKQNYFWAFFYNVIAIPIAAVGLLRPIIASLSMAFSDVIVVGNSLSIYKWKMK
ncbi:MAG: copper-translocating P-type ATPase [Bacteroidia bacterium]|nr:MAG: copper-translocating P-type ATPase [Bacteroidia bacterium]